MLDLSGCPAAEPKIVRQMQGRLKPSSKPEAELWDRLMKAWNGEEIALHRALAVEYTTKYPENVWGWVALADVLSAIALYGEARRALKKAQQLAPPEARGDILLQWGHHYRTKQNLNAAATWYRKAVAERPDTNSLVFLGTILAKQGEFAEAKRCHRRAIKLSTSTPDEAFYNLGLILRAEEKYAAALDAFDEAIIIDPQYAVAKRARDDIRQFLKRKGTA